MQPDTVRKLAAPHMRLITEAVEAVPEGECRDAFLRDIVALATAERTIAEFRECSPICQIIDILDDVPQARIRAALLDFLDDLPLSHLAPVFDDDVPQEAHACQP